MRVQEKVSHKHRAAPPVERLTKFEHSFILLSRPRARPFLDICWTRLIGLLAVVMRRHVCRPIALRIALAQWMLLLLCALPLAPVASAQPLGDEPFVEPVRREILAVYDGREEPRPDQTRIHRFAEMPLNHLGFVVTYWDVNAGVPSADRTANIRGILTWLRRAPPASFYLWAREQVEQGVRTVVLGDSGLPSGGTSLADGNELFAAIGFGLSGNVVDLTYGTRILHRDTLVGFERALDPVLPAFPIVGTFGSDVTSHLVLEHREGDLVLASSVVLTSNRGGYAASGYVVYEEPETGRAKWIIDPFAFFQKAFGAETHADTGRDHAVGPPHLVQPYRRRRLEQRLAHRGLSRKTHHRGGRRAARADRSLSRSAGGGRRDRRRHRRTVRHARSRPPGRTRALCPAAGRGRHPHLHSSLSVGLLRELRLGDWRSGSSVPTRRNGRRSWASACAVWPGGCFRDSHARATRPRARSSRTIRRAPTASFRSISIRKFVARSPPPRRWRPRASTARFIYGAAAPSRSRGRSRGRGGWDCAISTAAIPVTTLTSPRSATCRRSRGRPAPNGRSMPATPTTTSTSPTAAAASTAF